MLTATMSSPFLHPGSQSTDSSLAILGLRRDQLIPTTLHELDASESGYAEGNVTNTRFGSYPHSTLIGVPWGSQVLASAVDTGSRGRKGKAASKKRKLDEVAREDIADSHDTSEEAKRPRTAVTAASGFCHLLPPTPEGWTISLPHRTQVVYTPDYSFVLQRMRVRPGSVVIEAGAGSGSFTHAAVRAVFNGYPSTGPDVLRRLGRVFSYEYHEARAAELVRELASHGLGSLVRVTHRDVYESGFMLPPSSDTNPTTPPTASPLATAVFLDLPAPWLALPHLTRKQPSPLDPHQTIHLTCFLPCIEQAQRAIASMRTHGWVNLCMFEIAQRRLDVRRERTGVDLEGLRNVNATAANVGEAVRRLKEVEEKGRMHREATTARGKMQKPVDVDLDEGQGEKAEGVEGKQARLARLKSEAESRKTFAEGRLVHRVEQEIKTHTSYLIFGILPREWTAEDEAAAAAKWAKDVKSVADAGVSSSTVEAVASSDAAMADVSSSAVEPEGAP